MASPKILVVDDDESILVLLEKRLQTDGYQVIKAMTGKEALSKAKLFLPHLIILDIMLPDMDGGETVKHLKAAHETCRIPVIFLSGIVEEDGGDSPTVTVEDQVYSAVAKPIDFQVLSGAINQYIQKGEEDASDKKD